jgi:hypothetical protein
VMLLLTHQQQQASSNPMLRVAGVSASRVARVSAAAGMMGVLGCGKGAAGGGGGVAHEGGRMGS